ncbi:hypothetical protein CANDROIZ_330017 [Candidatus Roizmanbacteria bacterium]|nr:hypothetical protein CANDROIZ_330017 [Candidatus Roizmanbacteria bacterium]
MMSYLRRYLDCVLMKKLYNHFMNIKTIIIDDYDNLISY